MKFRTSLIMSFAFALSLSTAFAADDSRSPDIQQFGPAFRLEAGLGWSEISSGGSIDGILAAGSGSAAFAVNSLHVQLDSVFRLEDFKGGDISVWGFGGHIGKRDETSGMYGINVAYSELKATGGNLGKNIRVGAEGEMFADNSSFGASAGYINFSTSGLPSVDAYYLKGLVRHYVNDNLKIEGSVGVVDPDGAGSFFYGHVMGEYKLDSSPISLFARWNGMNISNTGTDFNSIQLLAGVKIALGASNNGTIKSSDRRYFTDSCLFEASAFSVC